MPIREHVPINSHASRHWKSYDPINSHASYFGKSTGSNKRSVPINRAVSSNWHQRVCPEIRFLSWLRFFDWSNVADCFRTTLRHRAGSGRARVLLLVINFAIFMFPLNSSHYDYLLFKARYSWDVADFSNYLTAQRVCRSVILLGKEIWRFSDWITRCSK